MVKTRNVLNEPSVTKLVERLAEDKPDHIKAWYRSTLRTWFMQEAEALPVVCLRNVDPSIKFMLNALALSIKGRSIDAIMEDHYHMVDYDSQPEWARKKIDDKIELYWVVKPSTSEIDTLRHWGDYMMTLPERQIKHTVKDMKNAVKAWDEMLRKAKIKADAFKGYELQDILTLKSVPFKEWKFYKLTTTDARKYEGSMMNHCVGGGGYNRADIWSLMKGDHHEVTLQTRLVVPKVRRVRTDRGAKETPSVAEVQVVQARGNSNVRPGEEATAVLNAIYAELGWSDMTKHYDAEDDEEDDEDEDEDEEEDEEDEEEEDEEDDDWSL